MKPYTPRIYTTYQLNDSAALADRHKVTVHYTLPEGVSGIAGYVAESSAEFYEGQQYYMPTPALSGLVPDNRYVGGTMGKADIEHTVTYSAVPCTHMGTLSYDHWRDAPLHTIYCTNCKSLIGSEECDLYYSYNAQQHVRKCRKCDRSEAANHQFEHKQKDAFKHTDECFCGFKQDVNHALGKRFFYKWKKGYGQYIIYYAQKCTLCNQKLEGKVYYWDGHWFDMWRDREAFFKLLVEKGYVDDSWQNHPIQKYSIFGVESLAKLWNYFTLAATVLYPGPNPPEVDGVTYGCTNGLYLPDQMNPSDDPSLSQKLDLYAAKISADYGKLLGPSSDVDCVKEWKDSAGQINAAKAAGKQTPDSPQQALPPRAKAGGSPQVIADEDDGWADGELVRMLDDDYVIDESLALDDYEFDLTLSEAEQADSGALSIGGAAFSISPEFIATLEPGDHTITLWVEGVDHDTQEPVGFVVEKQIQVVDFAGDRMSTEAMVYNGRYASMSIDGRENGGFGVCDGKAHELNITLKTPDRTDANGGIIEAGTTLVEGRDYNLMYYRVNGGETMALTNEIRAAGEYLIVAAPQEISDACFGMAYNVYKVEAPELTDPDFVLPAGAMAVEDSAFEGSASINAVYVGDNCATIGESAFKDCEGLTQIRLPRFCVIGKDAFSGTPSLKAICAPTGLDDKAIANEDVEHMGSLADGTAEKWAADHNIPFVPIG